MTRVTLHAFHMLRNALHRHNATLADLSFIDQLAQRLKSQVLTGGGIYDHFVAIADDVMMGPPAMR